MERKHLYFMANLQHAKLKRETLAIGGGLFKPKDYEELIPMYSAAPDLLEALKLVTAELQSMVPATPNMEENPIWQKIFMGNAAIAKAGA